MTPEEDISDLIARGDRQAVKAWLNAEDADVNSFGLPAAAGVRAVDSVRGPALAARRGRRHPGQSGLGQVRV